MEHLNETGSQAGNTEHAALLRKPIAAPTLAIVGDADIIDSAMFNEATTLFTGGYQVEVVPGAGHFVHQEASSVVIEHILAFVQHH